MLDLQDYGFLVSAVNTAQIKGSDAPYVAEVLKKLQRLIEKEAKKTNNNK